MKHYMKLDGDIIVDAIQYPSDGYIEVELTETQLPAGINAGYYRWNGTNYMLDENLKKAQDEHEKARIIEQHKSIFEEERQKAQNALMEDMLLRGVI